jgi:hypothetical protein
VPSVIRHRITGEQSSHQGGNACWAASEQKMGVIKHKRPCVAPGYGFRQKNRKPFDEVFAILFIIEYSAALYAPDHDMVQKAGRIEAGCSWHEC